MSRTRAVGIDIGTYKIKVVVAEVEKNNPNAPTVTGVGFSESKGLRHGYIINPHEAGKSLRHALEQAEKTSGTKIRKAFLSVGGVGLAGVISQGSVAITRADREVTELDLSNVQEAAEHAIPGALALNRKVIHVIPLQYKLDGRVIYGRPVGMKGAKFEVKALFVSCLSQHLEDLIQTVESAGVDVEDVMASPLAASLVILTRAQKIAGCVLANIGAETVSIVVFENNIPISLEVFPVGSAQITHDIALGLKVPLDEAEQIKHGAITATSYSRKKLDEIIEARLSDVFDMIETHLKKIAKNELLPAGVIITGGGSGVGTIEDLAKASLKLPSKIGEVSFGGTRQDKLRDSTWAVAYGLCILGISQEKEDALGMRSIQKTKNSVLKWFGQFLP